jgi:glycosyltransferase involved in cell wall biosynthesis
MKILLANKFYYRRGGDCIYTINLEQLLRQHGHDVAIFAMDYPENIETEWNKYFPSEVKFKPGLGMIEAFKRPFGTSEVKKKFTKLIDDFRPDILHLNNIHSQISPVIAEIAHNRGIRVVWTLHDYKLLCPRYDCLRNGKDICEACFSDKRGVLLNKCMKNSKIASFLSYWEANKWNRERIEFFTDAFICPSQFMGEKMIRGDFNASKLIVLNNFIDVEKCKKDVYHKENYYCFMGRLSEEKGISLLIRTAKTLPYNLKIIGDGPMREKLESNLKLNNVEFVGKKDWEEIKVLVGEAMFIVTPSEWYENNPLSVIESLCLGTPVLGARIGGIPELIDENVNGMTFESRNMENLSSKIEVMWKSTFDYEAIANTAQEKYNAETYYEKLLNIYNKGQI